MQGSPRKVQPATTFIPDSSLPELWKDKFLLFKFPPVVLCYGNQSNLGEQISTGKLGKSNITPNIKEKCNRGALCIFAFS